MMQIRQVGANGQISLGKKFAGQVVSIEQTDTGKWVVQSGNFIPDNEKWLYHGDNIEKLDKALAWAEKTPPQDNFAEFLAEMRAENDDDTN